jgi:hypothetical protein
MRILAILVIAVLVTRADARSATGYQGGQKVKVKVVEVRGAEIEVTTAKAFKTMARAARKAGIELAIRSGFRTHAKQARLYRQYRRGAGNLAARPGYSQHESGRALDLVITQERTYRWLLAHASEFGFHRTVRGEPWHWEYLGDASKTAVELGVVSGARAGHDDYGEYPCTQDRRFAPPAPPAEQLEQAPTDDEAAPGAESGPVDLGSTTTAPQDVDGGAGSPDPSPDAP